MRSRTLAAAALLAGSVAVAAPLAPVHAADTDPVESGLFLTVSGSERTWIRGVELHCDPQPVPPRPKAAMAPPHPRAEASCALLDDVHGDLDALPERPMPCTMQYDPVTVTASGTHRGRAVSWHRTFPNQCALNARTGPLFDF
ncbi:SSI family serine proteinase inhibitor [Streptomyces boluensis]|uniref:Protease inhibitor SIL-V5 n=1 Tax=Streptomyces boluensis TaxID=1775135 RepID=A0A964XNM3_9ACTN|nr:SSI family serine proteinase inhibitor [Streptomyces boluensis]NBE55809.1 protease inhibitor SIL-V5 [Streptomyces boluensis]